jgi:CheY-like chemotaxis protein
VPAAEPLVPHIVTISLAAGSSNRRARIVAVFDPAHPPDEWARRMLVAAAQVAGLLLELERANGRWPLGRATDRVDGAAPLIGSSAAIRAVRDRIERVAATDFSILIEGASGPQPHPDFIGVFGQNAVDDGGGAVAGAGHPAALTLDRPETHLAKPLSPATRREGWRTTCYDLRRPSSTRCRGQIWLAMVILPARHVVGQRLLTRARVLSPHVRGPGRRNRGNHRMTKSVRAGHQKPILIADDDAHTRDGLAEFLTNAGYRVICARDGQEAMNLLVGGLVPMLLVMDIAMPHVAGDDVLKYVHTDPILRSIPVLVVTGAPELAGRAVADAIAAKPVDLAWLLTQVQRLTADAGTKSRKDQ